MNFSSVVKLNLDIIKGEQNLAPLEGFMVHFHLGQCVRVNDKDHPLFGKEGTVVRVQITDYGAWINMDEDLPEELRQFSDKYRKNHVLLYPEQCEPVGGFEG